MFLKIIYLLFILAMLDLHCRTVFSLAVESRGYFLAVVCWLLIVVASLVVERGLWSTRLR